MIAEVGILNVGCGDTKLVFDIKDPEAMKKAARIVTDMIKRGYVLMVETNRKTKLGAPVYQRVLRFRPDRYEYIISDIGDANEQEAAASRKGRIKTRSVHASSTRAVAVPRTAGG